MSRHGEHVRRACNTDFDCQDAYGGKTECDGLTNYCVTPKMRELYDDCKGPARPGENQMAKMQRIFTGTPERSNTTALLIVLLAIALVVM